MTQTRTSPQTAPLAVRRPRAWPLTAVGAGLSGVAAGLVAEVDRGARASLALGCLTVVLLLVSAAQWHRRVETRVPRSTAAHLVPLGLLASAGALTYGWTLDASDLDVGTGWLGVVVAAGGVVWMAFRERTVSRWLGVVSVLPALQVVLVVAGTGGPALLAPSWLVVVGLGLALGSSTVVR